MKMVKNLSKVIVRNHEEFNLREDLNFSDDGSYFRGFDYKGLPITTLRSNDKTYLSIRVDYLDNEFTYHEWMKTDESKLADEFNGVYDFDLDKLIDNCERIIAKVNELNEKAREEVIDTKPIEEKLNKEIKMAENVVEFVKTSLKWWELSDYELKNVSCYMKSTLNKIERMKNIDFENIDKSSLRRMKEHLNEYGYVKLRKDDFYLREMYNYCNKSNQL